jgi:hypothetical protein
MHLDEDALEVRDGAFALIVNLASLHGSKHRISQEEIEEHFAFFQGAMGFMPNNREAHDGLEWAMNQIASLDVMNVERAHGGKRVFYPCTLRSEKIPQSLTAACVSESTNKAAQIFLDQLRETRMRKLKERFPKARAS